MESGHRSEIHGKPYDIYIPYMDIFLKTGDP